MISSLLFLALSGAPAAPPLPPGVHPSSPEMIAAATAMQNHDYATAYASFKAAADKGDTQAENMMAWLCEHGLGTPQDDVQAVAWFQKAADQGDAEGESNLGTMYMAGRGVAKDEKVAFSWFMKAAQTGDPTAANNVGALYANGVGVDKDPVQAMIWYRKAADGGVAPAQFIVGNSLLQGTGVPKDEATGIAWLKKAAAQNFPLALDDLGVMYVQGGAGLTKDPVQATALFHKSASLGDPRGIGFLALSYATGTGVTQNLETAYALFSLATIANFPNAAAARDKAAAMLTPDQIARARASIEGWRPGKPLPGDPAPATAH